MKEIEIKILEIDVDQVIGKLEGFGAKRVFDGELDVKFYDFPGNLLKDGDKSLRLRKRSDAAELTFKHKLSQQGVKIAEEYQVNVDDFEEAQQILKSLGLIEFKNYIKNRISYSLDGASFEIDTLEGCPTFLEIEAPTAEDVENWVTRLGFDMKDAKPWSGSEVLKYYQMRNS